MKNSQATKTQRSTDSPEEKKSQRERGRKGENDKRGDEEVKWRWRAGGEKASEEAEEQAARTAC